VQRRPVFCGVLCRPLPADASERRFSPGCLSRFRRTPVKPFHHQMLRRNLVGMGEKCLAFPRFQSACIRGAPLNRATGRLQALLPGQAGSWGLARKCLNIFLRDSFYNAYLRSDFELTKAEQWYEVPLDSNVAKGLQQRAGKARPVVPLPKWTSIKALSPANSQRFQDFASTLAREEGLPARVHLDLIFWRPADSTDDGSKAPAQ
jgi:hypothetical protein